MTKLQRVFTLFFGSLALMAFMLRLSHLLTPAPIPTPDRGPIRQQSPG